MKIAGMESDLRLLEARIQAADPGKVLERGYVLATDAQGRVLKSISGRKAGDAVAVMFADGVMDCEVVDCRPAR